VSGEPGEPRSQQQGEQTPGDSVAIEVEVESGDFRQRVRIEGQPEQVLKVAPAAFELVRKRMKGLRVSPEPPDQPAVPPWMPIVGVVFSAITLVFFMALVLISVLTGRTPPPNARYLVVITLSFCAAFSTLGLASIAAHGSLPGQVGKGNPIRFAAVGSIAAFIVVFILANYYYPDAGTAPPREGGAGVFEAPAILAPVISVNRFLVGGWEVSLSNPNPSMMSISHAYLVSPEGSFPADATTKDLAPLHVTSFVITAFGDSPQGQSNLETARKKLMFMDYETTNCALEVAVIDIKGQSHSARQEFKCGQIFYMKNPPSPPK
jgi:hypothetical protein